jgi:hypothetical protein
MFNYEVKPADALAAKFWEDAPRMSDAEFFHRSAKRTFGTSTTLGLAAAEAEITLAENREGTRDQVYELFSGASEDELNGIDISRHAYALSEDDWKASAHYDKRLPWSPTMTETRARILKENLDRRDAEDKELAREGAGAWRSALSFTAGMVAALPDPINLLPFGAGIKAATLGKAALQGAKAGVAGNLVADAVIFPWAQSHGEEPGFTDLLKDGIFGAALGMGFGMFGHGFGRWLGSRKRTGDGGIDSDGLTPFDLTPDEFLASPAQRLRNELLGRDRVNAGRLVDAVLRDIDADRPLDVRGHARKLGMDAPPYIPDGLPLVRTARLIADGERPLWRPDMDFSEMIPLARDYYLNNLAGQTAPSRLGDVEIIAERWGKIKDNISPDKLRLIPFIKEILRDALPTETKMATKAKAAEMGVVRHFLRAAVELDGKTLDVWLSVQQASNGKYFYNLMEWGEFGPDGRGKRRPPDTRGPSGEGYRGNGGGDETGGSTPRRPTAPDGGARADTGSASGETLAVDAGNVNLEVRDVTPDWTPEAPEPAPHTPTPEERAIADRALDGEVARLADEGRVSPEERALIDEKAVEIDAVNRQEEAALATLSCIMGVD